jgi:hypothetical protein
LSGIFRLIARARSCSARFIEVFKTVLAALRSAFRSRAALLAENAVLCPSPAFVREIASCSLSPLASSARCSRLSPSCGQIRIIAADKVTIRLYASFEVIDIQR